MRHVSITFDDGFVKTASLVSTMSNWHYSFYVVTSWIKTDLWLKLADHGHEIGSHTVNHTRASHPKFNEECLASLHWLHTVHRGPYTMAFPYGEAGPDNHFDAYKANEFAPYVDLANQPLILPSVNPVWDAKTKTPRPFDSIYDRLDQLPDGAWLLITFHGIDEGWSPITINEFYGLIRYLEAAKIMVSPVNKLIRA